MTVKEFLDMSCFTAHDLTLLIEHERVIDDEYILLKNQHHVDEKYADCIITGFHDEECEDDSYYEMFNPSLVIHIKEEVRK